MTKTQLDETDRVRAIFDELTPVTRPGGSGSACGTSSAVGLPSPRSGATCANAARSSGWGCRPSSPSIIRPGPRARSTSTRRPPSSRGVYDITLGLQVRALERHHRWLERDATCPFPFSVGFQARTGSGRTLEHRSSSSGTRSSPSERTHHPNRTDLGRSWFLASMRQVSVTSASEPRSTLVSCRTPVTSAGRTMPGRRTMCSPGPCSPGRSLRT